MPYLTISANNELQHPFWSVSQKNPAKVVPYNLHSVLVILGQLDGISPVQLEKTENY